MNLYLPKRSKPFRWKKPPKEPEFVCYKCDPASISYADQLRMVERFFRNRDIGLPLGASIKEG